MRKLVWRKAHTHAFLLLHASCPCCSPHYFPRASLHLSISHFPQRMRHGILFIIPPYIFKTLTFIFKVCQAFDERLKSVAVALGHGLLITELHTPSLCRGGRCFSSQKNFSSSRGDEAGAVCSHWLCSVDKASSWHLPSLWHPLNLLALRQQHRQRLASMWCLPIHKIWSPQSLPWALCHRDTLCSHPLLTN